MSYFADYTRASAALGQALNQIAKPLKLRPVEAYILFALMTDACWRAGDLARFVGYPITSATPILDALEAKGLVYRTPDGNDRRVVNLQLTQAGAAMRVEVMKAVADMEAACVELWHGQPAEVVT